MINYEKLYANIRRVTDRQIIKPEMSIQEIDKMIYATKEEMSYWKNGIDDEGFDYNNYLENLLNLKSEYRQLQIDNILKD